MLALRKKQAQSILEYTLLLGVVTGIIILTLVANGGVFRTGVEKAYNKSADALGNAADNISNAVFQ
ncbi:MAG: hypothetical protein PHF11_04870 [Candidatus Omnitrophica bacterium]|nr:hypothetical protein [Candidatus Omnitrophota bacterium]